MQLAEFSSQQRELLNDFLNSQTQAMSLIESEGYLFAIICAPEPLDVQQWLDVVVPQNQGSMPEEVLFAFMALYHHISEQVFETGFHLPSLLQTDNQIDLSACQQWCSGFAQGAQEYLAKLANAPQLSIELQQALLTAQQSLSFFRVAEQQLADIANQHGLTVDTLVLQQYDVMADFALGFAELVEIVAVNSGLYNDEGWD